MIRIIDLNSAADKVLADVATGKVVPIIAQTLALQQANEAHRLLAEGGLPGKIVLVP